MAAVANMARRFASMFLPCAERPKTEADLQAADRWRAQVVILACGGNIDVAMLGRCLERGLVADGRLLSFTVFVEQNTTSLSELFALLGRVGASVKDMVHDRKWDSENFFLFPVKIIVETPGASTSRELRTALSQMYKKICFHHSFGPITSHQPMYPDFPKVECGAGNEISSKRNTSILAVKGGSCQRESVVRWPDGMDSGSCPTNQRHEPMSRGRCECQDRSSPLNQRSESAARGRSECQEIRSCLRRESVARGRSECQDIDQRCESVARGQLDSASKGSCTFQQDQSQSARCVPKETRSNYSPAHSGSPN